MPSSCVVVVGVLLSVLSCVAGQGGPIEPVTPTVTVGAQYTASQSNGAPSPLTLTAPQYAFVNESYYSDPLYLPWAWPIPSEATLPHSSIHAP